MKKKKKSIPMKKVDIYVRFDMYIYIFDWQRHKNNHSRTYVCDQKVEKKSNPMKIVDIYVRI